MTHYTSDNQEHIGIHVFLDGREVLHVVECDTEAGWVKQWKRDSLGDLVVADNKVQTEIIFGAVTVDRSFQW